MATTRAVGRGPKSPVDEEFLQQLYRGGELLAQGRLNEAREHLERAHELQPKNEKGQNLLGLAYFKLGLFDRAAEVYEALVRDNPADATLRVNLGLVYLKTNALQRAVREFEAATDLSPDHVKAHNYLGLALAQAGEYGRAREHFLLAGSDVMAEKMAKAIAGEGFAPSRSAPAPSASASATHESAWGAQFSLEETPGATATAPPADEEEMRFAEDEGPGSLSGNVSEPARAEEEPRQGPPAAAEPSEAVVASPSLPAEPEPEPAPSRSLAFRPGGEVPVLGELVSAVALAGASATSPFRVGNGSFSVQVAGELLTRLEGLLALTGQLQFQPEVRRSRGRATDIPFGEGAGRLMRVSGQGVLFIEPGARSFLAVDLCDEAAYLREECVFAFEEPVCFDNGQVPSELAPGLELVYLRGHGRVLLRLPGALRSVAVREGEPVTVPSDRLVGWQGKLSPRVVSLPTPGGEPSLIALELEGEGFALISLPVR
jgi:uncharacterized protein (AIM24 family)